MDYYIVNLSHQRRDQPYIGVWRPECKGYAWPLSWAGRYAETVVRSALGYYNSGENVAVPCKVLDEIALEKPMPGWIDGDAGPVVRNTKETWQKILASVIAPPKYQPWPEYRGAPRRKRSNGLGAEPPSFGRFPATWLNGEGDRKHGLPTSLQRMSDGDALKMRRP